MSVITDILNVATGGLIGQVKELISSTNTTDKERIELANKAAEAIQQYQLKVNEQIIGAEAQLTARQAADMASDSWLSKNVRPLVLVFLTVMMTILAYTTIFTLPQEKINLLTPWIGELSSLLGMVYGFYFGSRGLEKIGQMVTQTLKK